jgi:hypothetical protein
VRVRKACVSAHVDDQERADERPAFDRLRRRSVGYELGGNLRLGGLVESRLLRENRLLESPQMRARLHPELVGEQPPASPIDLERLRLPVRTVERQHQLAAKTVAQRVLGDERIELGNQRLVPAEYEVGLDPLLERG